MYPIDTRTAAAVRPPTPEEGKPGWFTHGDPEKGEAPTVVDADWMNRVQAELMNVITGANMALKKDDSYQLLAAIQTLARGTPYVPGQIIAFAGVTPPPGTLACNGATVSREKYGALFSVIGEIYGAADGKTTFTLPHIRANHTLVQAAYASGIGKETTGSVLRHSHSANTEAAEAHTHDVKLEAAGRHNHGAAGGGAGDHVHHSWTDQQGWHGHSGATNGEGNHTHGYDAEVWPNPNGAGRGSSYSWGTKQTSVAGHHAHAVGVDGNGNHGHNTAMAGAGHHSHPLDIAPGGEHAHDVRVGIAGGHEHPVTIGDQGGDFNEAAGLKILYCIAY